MTTLNRRASAKPLGAAPSPPRTSGSDDKGKSRCADAAPSVRNGRGSSVSEGQVQQQQPGRPVADITPPLSDSSPEETPALASIGDSDNSNNNSNSNQINNGQQQNPQEQQLPLADALDFVTIPGPDSTDANPAWHRPDKASRVLGIAHRRSMEPIPASARTSMVSSRSVPVAPPTPGGPPSLPLTSLYVVSGLPKSPHTWTLADPDSVLGLHHTDGAVARWWRPEVLGSTISPGAGGGTRKKRKGKETDLGKGAGALSKAEVGKMLSKALKLSFTREVEIIASTLQPASTIHTFTFTLPAPATPLAPNGHSTSDILRSSVFTADRSSAAPTFAYPYTDDPFANARPSSAFLGPPNVLGASSHSAPSSPLAAMFDKQSAITGGPVDPNGSGNVTYHGVCLTVWSHADAERSAAIRRTLEAGRTRKESAQSLVAARLRALKSSNASISEISRKRTRRNRTPWGGQTDGETGTDGETDTGMISESDFEVASTINGHGPGESTPFLPGDTVFWLPYALTLVSRHPIYDLMRDYLTLSWARFSKDVQSHTLQISKILAHPAPRAGELVKLDASSSQDASLEVIARFPGGLDFGRGLVDINFTMWPLFKCLNIDNILTACEIALAPTGRILFFSRHPALLGIAVSTLKYLVELRGWSGIALPAVHSRDAKIYIDDPGPWILGLATEARYAIRPGPEVCVVDLDINYLSCPSPPPGIVSQKQQRERYRQRLLAAFEPHYHPDHCIPSEFKEAFPAGRFRPVCKIQAKRGAETVAVADTIKSPDWWHSTRIIQAFDAVLHDKFKKPSLFKRISSLGSLKRPPQLTAAEQHIQLSIRRRATAFVDARDDLETKIGRLSRRLNFLMTEADLWRDKFVTFEQYAERLSTEASQLRAKVGKEQKETKRLSGMVTYAAAEKTKLQQQLYDTERAHQEALIELHRMREDMERMEMERAEMVAEVEAQIERALASMAVDVESDYGGEGSRPGSRLSSSARSTRSAPSGTRSRGPSDATRSSSRLRSVATESTLAESFEDDMEDGSGFKARGTETIEEEDEAAASPRRKRFSATGAEALQDGMVAVDEGISERSDRIAMKVFQIQQKLETALASERVAEWKAKSAEHHHSADDERESDSDPHIPVRTRRSSKASGRLTHEHLTTKHKRKEKNSDTSSLTHKRDRSDTVTTAHRRERSDATSTAYNGTAGRRSCDTISSSGTPRRVSTSYETERQTPTLEIKTDTSEHTIDHDQSELPSKHHLDACSPMQTHTPTTPSLTPAVSATTDDSDTEFQSAYSESPRHSRASFEGDQRAYVDSDGSTDGDGYAIHANDYSKSPGGRERVPSSATTVCQA